jgi:ADP-ribosylglycohydrolase
MIWALETAPNLTDYLSARKILDERFAGMHFVHTNNNACAIVFALYLGKGDFTKTISIAVGMGLDNDCTAATCGSIIGAIVGPEGIAPHWTCAFHDKVRTYINDAEELRISDVVERFVSLYNQFSEIPTYQDTNM